MPFVASLFLWVADIGLGGLGGLGAFGSLGLGAVCALGFRVAAILLFPPPRMDSAHLTLDTSDVLFLALALRLNKLCYLIR